ncbi:hypothetical protein P5V34_04745 [Mycobacteroides abscessus subsp. abscessus]|jgi:hypothetical protein|uniref:hypothetical protein n=1 Tax=Mycobacteroides abscessus TaxID=36809 RepID=UPI00266BF3DF|nr:hypothetical protein [Mycobacteroides abscessus]MDO3013295.1 hypothetical protein [Mycobacteroides abscessus subsp. abscessus]
MTKTTSRDGNAERAARLPVRWALIALLAADGGAIAFVYGGPVPALMAACAVATAGHRLIA